MSIKLIKKSTSSPFQLQRSIVPQEEGAYQRGGYNPYALYNNDAANEAIESFSKTIGDAISTMDFSKKKKEEKSSTGKSKPGSAPNKPEKVIDINELSNTGSYSDYSGQSMMPLSKEEKKRKDFELARSRYENREEKKRKGFELARSAYEKQEEEKQKKKNPLSGLYF